MTFKQYTGKDRYFSVPAIQDNAPITVIGAKAFLSCKTLEKLVLPASVTAVENWAFSHMHNLKELEMPANPILFGKQVFLGSDSLQRIRLYPDDSQNPGLPFFLSNIAVIFADARLLDPVRAASKTQHPSWMQEYDALLTAYLYEDDLTGFEPVFYGWVNDEDADVSQKPEYLFKQRYNKTKLAFQRLIYDKLLSEAHRELLCSYLRGHMPWGQWAMKHTAVWDLLPTHFGQDVQYCRILEKAGALPVEHIPELVEHLSAASPEVIAWLLHYQEENLNEFDFFDSLAF